MDWKTPALQGVDFVFGDYSETRKKGFRPFVQRTVAATLYGIAAASLLAFGAQALLPDLVLATSGLLDYLVVSQSLPTAISAYTLARYTVFDANADGGRPTTGFLGHLSDRVIGDFSPNTQWSLASYALRFGGLLCYLAAAYMTVGAAAGLFPESTPQVAMYALSTVVYIIGRGAIFATRPDRSTQSEKRDENETPVELVL